MEQDFVGREAAGQQLGSWLLGTARARTGNVSVGWIVGSGGIGKTALWQRTWRSLEVALEERRYWVARLRGHATPRVLSEIVKQLAEDCESPDHGRGQFRATFACLETLRRLDNELLGEMVRQVGGDSALADVIGSVSAVLGAGFQLASIVAPPGVDAALRAGGKLVELLDRKHGKAAVARLIGMLRGSQTVATETGKGANVRQRNELRQDLAGTLARNLVKDWGANLSQPRSLKVWKTPGMARLLLLLDDYEALRGELGDFVVGPLMRCLKQARFETLIVVLGREADESDPSWQRAHKDSLLEPRITLAELSREDSEAYIRGRGVTDAAAVARIQDETNGYPMLLELTVQDELCGNPGGVVARREFFDRITQWMSPEQKQWALALAFLDEVNLDTIPRVLPEAEPRVVLDWFERAGLLMNRKGAFRAMVPAIGSRFREYVRLESPRRHDELIRAAVG